MRPLRSSTALLALLAALPASFSPSAAVAQAPREDPQWVKDDRDKRVALSVPGMDRVFVRKDLTYRRVGETDLKMDVYLPPGLGAAERRPAVVLVHGGALPANLLTEPKAWGQFRSLGEILAASGFVAVAFNHRFFGMKALADPESDLLALLDRIRGGADDLRIDRDRIALWVFSGSGLLLAKPMRESPPFVRALVSYYAILDPGGIERARPGSIPESVARDFSPLRVLAERGTAIPPLLVVRAGLDRPQINESVDQFVRLALERNADVEVVNTPESHHGFDIEDGTERSRQILRRTLQFLRERLGN